MCTIIFLCPLYLNILDPTLLLHFGSDYIIAMWVQLLQLTKSFLLLFSNYGYLQGNEKFNNSNSCQWLYTFWRLLCQLCCRLVVPLGPGCHRRRTPQSHEGCRWPRWWWRPRAAPRPLLRPSHSLAAVPHSVGEMVTSQQCWLNFYVNHL